MLVQSEQRAANISWNYYAYGRTVHAFTLMENPVWDGSKSMVSYIAAQLYCPLPVHLSCRAGMHQYCKKACCVLACIRTLLLFLQSAYSTAVMLCPGSVQASTDRHRLNLIQV